MSVIYIVLPLALLIAAAAVVAFSWAAKRGQFDDLETPAHRILLDDDPVDVSKPKLDQASSHSESQNDED